MATKIIQLEQSDFEGIADAFRILISRTHQASLAMLKLGAAIERCDANLPGAWPDNFILLNRYLRTGVKPEYLINDF